MDTPVDTPVTRHESFALNLAVHKNVQTLRISPDLAVVKVTYEHQTQPGWPTQLPALPQLSCCHQVLCTADALAAFEAGQVELPQPHPALVLTPSEFAQRVAESSFDDGLGLHFEQGRDLTARVFDAFATGQATLDQLVELNTGAHLVYDRHGQPMPVAQHLSYLRGSFDNGHYDLEKALAVLKAHPRVKPAPERRGAQADELTISAIPYYNVDGGRTHHLSFVWTPTAQEMAVMLEESARLNPRYPSVELPQAMFKLDLLGLRKAGAAKFQDYWQSTE